MRVLKIEPFANMISAHFERSVFRHPASLLIGCAGLMTLCWAQSMSHLTGSSREFFEQSLGRPSVSAFAAYAGSSSFAPRDLTMERDALPMWSQVGMRIKPTKAIWTLGNILFRDYSIGHRACIPEREPFPGAALATFDYARLSSSPSTQSVR
jgi:hypothetical protein